MDDNEKPSEENEKFQEGFPNPTRKLEFSHKIPETSQPVPVVSHQNESYVRNWNDIVIVTKN